MKRAFLLQLGAIGLGALVVLSPDPARRSLASALRIAKVDHGAKGD